MSIGRPTSCTDFFFPLWSVPSCRMSHLICFLISQEIRLKLRQKTLLSKLLYAKCRVSFLQRFFYFLLYRGLFSRVSHPCVPLMKLRIFLSYSPAVRAYKKLKLGALYALLQIAGLIRQILLLQIFLLEKVRLQQKRECHICRIGSCVL